MSEKVNAVKLNSASVKYDNSVDAERVYDITADANLRGKEVVSMDGGVVVKDGVNVASFSMYGNHQINYNINGVEEVAEQCSILVAIHAFADEVEKNVEVSSFNI